MEYFIYKTTNRINGKVYIGQHSKGQRSYLGSGKKLRFAIKKYGRRNFTREVLIYCKDKQELNEYEELYIELYSSTNPNIGYNMTLGGHYSPALGYHHTDEWKKENAERMKGNQHAKGSIMTKEHKEMLKQLNRITMAGENNHMYGKRGELCPNFGKKRTEEERKRNGELKKGNTYNLGKKRSEESKKKMSESAKVWLSQNEHNFKGKTHTEESRRKISENCKAYWAKKKQEQAK